MKVQLKQMKKTKARQQIDLDLLKQWEYKDRYNFEVRKIYEFLNIEETPQQPEQEFIENKQKSIKTCFTEALKISLPKKTNRKKPKWRTDDILNKMDETKVVKGRNEECYQQLNKEISSDCRVAKENWLNEQCREVEDLERQFRRKEMQQKIKQMTKKSKTNTNMGCIKDRNGIILFEKENSREMGRIHRWTIWW